MKKKIKKTKKNHFPHTSHASINGHPVSDKDKIIVGVFQPRRTWRAMTSSGMLVMTALASGAFGSYAVYQSMASPLPPPPAQNQTYSYSGTIHGSEKNFQNTNYKKVQINSAAGNVDANLRISMGAGHQPQSYWTLCIANSQNYTLACDQAHLSKPTAHLKLSVNSGTYFVTATYYPRTPAEYSSYDLYGSYNKFLKATP